MTIKNRSQLNRIIRTLIIRRYRYPPSKPSECIPDPRLFANVCLVPIVANNRELTVMAHAGSRPRFSFFYGNHVRDTRTKRTPQENHN